MSSLKSLLSNSSNPPANVEVPILETSTATDTPTTLNVSSVIPALPPCNQVPPLLMLSSPADLLTPDIVEKLFQVYQHLPAHDSHHYCKYLQCQSPIPMDTLKDKTTTSSKKKTKNTKKLYPQDCTLTSMQSFL